MLGLNAYLSGNYHCPDLELPGGEQNDKDSGRAVVVNGVRRAALFHQPGYYFQTWHGTLMVYPSPAPALCSLTIFAL